MDFSLRGGREAEQPRQFVHTREGRPPPRSLGLHTLLSVSLNKSSSYLFLLARGYKKGAHVLRSWGSPPPPPSSQLSAQEALWRINRAGPSTAPIYCLQIFFFAFLMKLSIFIMVLAITGMRSGFKASDKEKACALPILSPSLESVTSDKVGHSDSYKAQEIWLGKSNCHTSTGWVGPRARVFAAMCRQNLTHCLFWFQFYQQR